MNPALTAEEWEICHREGAYECDGYIFTDDGGFVSPTRRGVAAFLLYTNEGGFTREDVKVLRKRADRQRKAACYYDYPLDAFTKAARTDDLADRIEALLPPETK